MKTKMIWICDSYEGNLKATLGGDYKLRLNTALFNMLPEYIRIGFDIEKRSLHIIGGEKGNGSIRKRKTINMYSLAIQLIKEGLILPVNFNFTWSADARWIGNAYINRKHKDFAAQLILLKKPMIKMIVYTKAKSMPCEDRWQIANIALLETARICHPAYIDFDDFAKWLIIKRLKEENRGYAKQNGTISFDASGKNSSGDERTLHDKIKGKSDVGKEAEDRWIRRNFKELSDKFMKMLLRGDKLPQIADALGISEEAVYRLAEMIGEMRAGAGGEEAV